MFLSEYRIVLEIIYKKQSYGIHHACVSKGLVYSGVQKMQAAVQTE